MRLFEASEQAIREIVEEARSAREGSEARKFGDLYESFMNEERIEAAGRLTAAARISHSWTR